MGQSLAFQPRNQVVGRNDGHSVARFLACAGDVRGNNSIFEAQ
jgi:hypothetical protein